MYNVEDKQAVVDGIQRNTLAIRGLVGRKIKNKVRRIPEFNFYLDDTLDEVFKIDNLFKKLKDDKEL